VFLEIYYEDIFYFMSSIYKKNAKELIWNPFVSLFFFFYMMQVIVYLWSSKNYPTPQIWIEGIKKNCPEADINSEPHF